MLLSMCRLALVLLLAVLLPNCATAPAAAGGAPRYPAITLYVGSG